MLHISIIIKMFKQIYKIAEMLKKRLANPLVINCLIKMCGLTVKICLNLIGNSNLLGIFDW